MLDAVKAIRETAAINRGQSSEVILASFTALADELERQLVKPGECGGQCQYCSTPCAGPFVPL